MSETASLDGWYKMPRAIYGIGLSGNQIALYGALASFADANGQCYPSHKALAERAGISEKTARRGLRVLASKGVMTVTNRVTQGGGATSNLYTVTTPTPSVIMTDPLGHSDRPPRSPRPTPSVTVTDEQESINKNQLTRINEREDTHSSIRLRNARARAHARDDDEHTTEIQPTRKSGQSPLDAIYTYGQQLGLTVEETQQEITKTQARNHTGTIRNPPAYLRKMLEVRAEQKTTQPVRLTAGQQAYLTNKTRYTQTATHTATAITEGQSHDNQTH